MSCRIHIPTACHENWNDMQPSDNGRHCESCCKTVVDFTNWEVEAIQKYLLARQGERTCGRFNNAQLASPVIDERKYVAAVKRYRGGFLQQFAAMVLLVFGLLAAGCTSSGETQLAATTIGDTTITVAPPYPVNTVNQAIGAPIAVPDSNYAVAGMVTIVPDTIKAVSNKPHKSKKHGLTR